MAISHTFRESKFLKNVVGGLSLHDDCVRALNWIALLSFFIKSNLTCNSNSELTYNFRDTFEHVVTRALGIVDN